MAQGGGGAQERTRWHGSQVCSQVYLVVRKFVRKFQCPRLISECMIPQSMCLAPLSIASSNTAVTHMHRHYVRSDTGVRKFQDAPLGGWGKRVTAAAGRQRRRPQWRRRRRRRWKPRLQKMGGCLRRGKKREEMRQEDTISVHKGLASLPTEATQATQATQPSSGVDACVDGDGGDHMVVMAAARARKAPEEGWMRRGKRGRKREERSCYLTGSGCHTPQRRRRRRQLTSNGATAVRWHSCGGCGSGKEGPQKR